MKIGIGFAVLNNFRGFTETIQSIKTKHDYRIYVAPQWRAQVPLAEAWNTIADQAFADGCDFALICNDDILFSPETIDAMVDKFLELHETEKVVMVTPNNIKAELADPYDILTYKRDDSVPATWAEHPNFSCFLIHKTYFELIGRFDENFTPAWYEDNDAHRRINLLGYKAITTTAAPQVHFGGVATSMMTNPDSSISREYYIHKWGGIPWPASEQFTHPYNDPSMSPREWVRVNMRNGL